MSDHSVPDRMRFEAGQYLPVTFATFTQADDFVKHFCEGDSLHYERWKDASERVVVRCVHDTLDSAGHSSGDEGREFLLRVHFDQRVEEIVYAKNSDDAMDQVESKISQHPREYINRIDVWVRPLT